MKKAQFEDDNGLLDVEGEEDLLGQRADDFRNLVVTDTDWTTETMLSQLRKGYIQLNPRFQRRDAWTVDRKSKFIESLFLGLPVPQIVLAENPAKKGSYIVIDGKQRLLSLQRFASPETMDDSTPLRLKNLTILPELNGKTLAQIKDSPDLVDFIPAFENQTIRTTVLRGWSAENILFLVFYRLNSGSLQLSAQELRHVLHPGPFIDFAFDHSEKSEPLHHIFGRSNKADFRMRDVELVIRFFGFHFFENEYNGNLKQFLDNTCLNLNRLWDAKFGSSPSTTSALVEAEAEQLDIAIAFTEELFGAEAAFRKWNGTEYERRFNRAVFDIMVHTFKKPRVRVSTVNMKEAVVEAYKALCNNPVFRRSIETTTKSKEATAIRFELWRKVLADLTGEQL